MRIGTAEPDSTFETQGQALRVLLREWGAPEPIDILPSPSAGIVNANLLDEGLIDFGFMAANWVGRAKAGEAPFERAVDLYVVAPMNAGPLFFIARPDSDLACVSDLRGRRVAVGARTSGMAQHARCMFESLAWKSTDVDLAYLDFATGAQALLDGEIDAQLQRPIPNKVMTELTEKSAVSVLPWTADQLERLFSTFPSYRSTVMQTGVVRGLTCNLPQPAVLNTLVTHARADAALVGLVASAIFEGAARLAELNPLFTGLRDLFGPLLTWGPAAFEFGAAGLHPGAIAAYRQKGLLS